MTKKSTPPSTSTPQENKHLPPGVEISEFVFAENGERVVKIVSPVVTGYVAASIPREALDALEKKLLKKQADHRAMVLKKYGRLPLEDLDKPTEDALSNDTSLPSEIPSGVEVTEFVHSGNGEAVTKIVTPDLTGYVAGSIPLEVLDPWEKQLDKKIEARKARLKKKHGQNMPPDGAEEPVSD